MFPWGCFGLLFRVPAGCVVLVLVCCVLGFVVMRWRFGWFGVWLFAR